MNVRIIGSTIFCITAARTDRDGHLKLQKRIATVKRHVSLHPFYVETGKELMAVWLPTSKNGIQIDAGVHVQVRIWVQRGCR